MTGGKSQRLAVITGASSGIGAACLQRFAGTRIIAVDKNREALAQFDDATVVAGDLSDGSTIARIAEAVGAAGGLDVLVHCAGISPSMGDSRRIVEVNLLASRRLADAMLPLANAGAVAILTASVAAHFDSVTIPNELLDDPESADALRRFAGLERLDAYNASKRGVIRYCERQAVAWGRAGARILSVSPGAIDTPMQDIEIKLIPSIPELVARTPAGRMGRPEEIADLIHFLASPSAAFMSGTDILMDGGALAATRALDHVDT
jgi:NAD(P)-dependent dehydrogenase (short-subunit alcohol dehydrogenase family)